MADLQLNANGIPTLAGGLVIQLPDLLSGDLLTNYGASQQWGVYLDGAPAVVFDTFVSIDYRRGWALSDYPVERGAFETYDKVQLPFDVRVKFASGGSEANRQALLDSVAAMAGTLTLYSVVTPEITYNSVNVQHYDYHRTATNGQGLIVIEMWLLEVRVTGEASSGAGATDITGASVGNSLSSGAGATGIGSNALDPSGFSPVNDGNVNPVDANISGFAGNVSGSGGGGGGGF